MEFSEMVDDPFEPHERASTCFFLMPKGIIVRNLLANKSVKVFFALKEK
jgi:hypothetical protein